MDATYNLPGTHSTFEISTLTDKAALTSQLTANGGFFFTNMLNILSPYALTVSTPPEVLPYGWSTLDLWVAPAITGLYALLTHAQPYWAELHYALVGWVGAAPPEGVAAPVDPEIARAACAVILAGLFGVRTYRAYAPSAKESVSVSEEKKTQ